MLNSENYLLNSVEQSLTSPSSSNYINNGVDNIVATASSASNLLLNSQFSPESINQELQTVAKSLSTQSRQASLSNLALSTTSTLDYAGNTLTAARQITVGSTAQTFSDWVGSTDTNDYYRFSLSDTSNFNLTLNGLLSDADVKLLDSTGNTITSSCAGGSASESIARQLAAGTYYIRVYPYSGNTSYNLSVSAASLVDGAGNTLAAARQITVGSTAQTFSDWVGSADTNDYYRFSLSDTSNFNLTLNGLSSDADVKLLDSTGNTITSSCAGGSSSESIARQLAAGTYYILVYPYSGNTSYNLGVSATSLVDGAGNTLAAARQITVGSSAQTFSDWVGSVDTNDYYRFSLSDTSNFNLTLNGLSSDADVRLLDGNGNTITGSYAGGSASESIARQLAAGTYYIRVYPYSGNTSYNLSVSAASLAPPDGAGNTLEAARQITVGSTAQIFSDWVGSADTNDYYRFSLSNTSNFNLTLNGLSSDANVKLLDSTGNTITDSYAGGSTSESIARQLTVGTYYIQVYSYSGNTSYNLGVSAVNIANPTLDWYGQNLRDSEVVNLTRSLAADGNLSRNDMISIFRNTQDGNVIDANELTDLRTLLNNSSRFTMQDYVVNLSNKIANGNLANVNSGFGNLYAGSSGTQLENLIGKWFFGNDRPDLTSSSYSYRSVSGSLFQNGISANDIKQGAVGDCYYLATLSSIAQEKPSYIQNMFTDNGDNTFTVRFFNNGVADFVTVDKYLPTNSSGYLVYANSGSSASNSTNELWVALAEKAYAQLAESGWTRSSSTNSYAAIEGGWMDAVVRQVTGLSTTSQSATVMSQTQLINLVNSNQILTAGFVSGGGFGVVNSHAYTITSYNATNQTFHLRNPWGYADADVTWAQLLSLNARIQYSNT